jgi:hypothetical protein
LQHYIGFAIFASTNNQITMKKITLSLVAIIGKLFSFSSSRNASNRQVNNSSEIKFDRRHENNGERWFHVFPTLGESYLGIALFQFELERAKAVAVA